MAPPELDDPRLERRRDLRRRGVWTARARHEPGRSLLQVAAPVTVEARPRGPVAGAHLVDRLSGALGLEQDLQLQLSIDTTFKTIAASRSVRFRFGRQGLGMRPAA